MLVITLWGGFGFGSCFGSGFGLGKKLIDDRLHEFIAAEVTRSIVDGTPVVFGTIKEGIIDLIDEWLRSFWAKIA